MLTLKKFSLKKKLTSKSIFFRWQISIYSQFDYCIFYFFIKNFFHCKFWYKTYILSTALFSFIMVSKSCNGILKVLLFENIQVIQWFPEAVFIWKYPSLAMVSWRCFHLKISRSYNGILKVFSFKNIQVLQWYPEGVFI